MNKAFEEILERLEEYEYNDLIEHNSEQCEHCKRIDCEIGMDCTICVMDKAKEMVQEVVEKYNNGWIPCSERLPEIRQDCLVTVRYTGFMGMHGFWVKTGHMESENDWCGDCSNGEVIAWQPLPEPYQQKGE